MKHTNGIPDLAPEQDPGPIIERAWDEERAKFRNLAHQIRRKAETAHVATADTLYKIARDLEEILDHD